MFADNGDVNLTVTVGTFSIHSYDALNIPLNNTFSTKCTTLLLKPERTNEQQHNKNYNVQLYIFFSIVKIIKIERINIKYRSYVFLYVQYIFEQKYIEEINKYL